MAERNVLTVEQALGLASMPRLAIIAALRANGPQSVSELARSLDVGPKGLYYHIRSLRELGLVKESDTRATVRRSESVYDLIGRWFYLDQSGTDPEMVDATIKVMEAIIRQNGRLWTDATNSLPPNATERDALFIETINARLTPEDVNELRQRLRETATWAIERSLASGGTRIALTTFSCPVV